MNGGMHSFSDANFESARFGRRKFRMFWRVSSETLNRASFHRNNYNKSEFAPMLSDAILFQGHLPPTMPGEWRDAHCYVVASSSGMHSELEVLEKFFLPAISTNLLPLRTYFTWTILLQQTEENIIGIPRRLAMVDRGHLPQSKVSVGQSEQVMPTASKLPPIRLWMTMLTLSFFFSLVFWQGGQPLCFPLVLVGGMEGRKPTPWELSFVRKKWEGKVGSPASMLGCMHASIHG